MITLSIIMLWGAIGIKSLGFWWSRCMEVSAMSADLCLLSAVVGPFTYVLGYITLNSQGGYDIFGREIKHDRAIFVWCNNRHS